MNDIAKTIMIGRLVRDAETTVTTSGTELTKFSLAVNRYGGKNAGDKVSFFNCLAWGKLGTSLAPYLTKGKCIAVDAIPEQNRWETRDGEKRSDVVFNCQNIQLLGGKGEKDAGAGQYRSQGDAIADMAASVFGAEPVTEGEGKPSDKSNELPFEDDIPF